MPDTPNAPTPLTHDDTGRPLYAVDIRARSIVLSPTPPPPIPTIDRWIDLAGKTPAELAHILRMRIEELDRKTDSRYSMDYCSGQYDYATPSGIAELHRPIPSGARWIIVWPVTGGSEGHYLHVEAVYQRDAAGRSLDHNLHRPLVLIKIFGGWAAAAELAGRIGQWLGA